MTNECGKCADCPVVGLILGAAEEMDDLARFKSEEALDIPFDEIGQKVFDSIPEGATTVDRNMTVLSEPAAVAASLRENIVGEIDALHDEADKARGYAQTLMNVCADGPLKMRAKKAGRTITATICGSAQAPDGVTKDEPVTIRRD